MHNRRQPITRIYTTLISIGLRENTYALFPSNAYGNGGNLVQAMCQIFRHSRQCQRLQPLRAQRIFRNQIIYAEQMQSRIHPVHTLTERDALGQFTATHCAVGKICFHYTLTHPRAKGSDVAFCLVGYFRKGRHQQKWKMHLLDQP